MAKNTNLDSEVFEVFSESKSEAVKTTEKKIGVVRFCQIRELKSGYVAIMKNRYQSEVHTLQEWDDIYENVLNRKVGK